MTHNKRRRTLYYAGFVDDKLHWEVDWSGWLTPSIYKSKALAKRLFEDVRAVEIRPAARKSQRGV